MNAAVNELSSKGKKPEFLISHLSTRPVRDLKYDPQLHNSLEKHKDIDMEYGLRSTELINLQKDTHVSVELIYTK